MIGPRVHCVDWLRCLAVLSVVVYHALLPFGSFMPWHIVNPDRSEALGIASALLPFAFAVFFVLAGAGARYALRTRSVGTFLADRAARLVVPFVVGTIVLTPTTGYVIALANGTAPPSALAFLTSYPGSLVDYSSRTSGLSPMVFQIFGMHLWFLAWLFIWCVLAAPILVWLSTRRGASLVDWLAARARVPGTTVAFALPLLLVALPLFRISSPAGWDWAVFGLWGGTFVGGYLLFADDRLRAAARRDLVPALAVAGLGIAGIAATGFTPEIFRGGAHTSDATYVGLVTLHTLAVWGVALSAVSLGLRLRFMQRPLPARASEWTLPIYLLHYPVVIAISALVVELPLGLWPKAVANVGLGLAVTLLVVAAIVRIRIMRPLLGLHAERRPSLNAARAT